jgi:hypothetical protein
MRTPTESQRELVVGEGIVFTRVLKDEMTNTTLLLLSGELVRYSKHVLMGRWRL